MKCGHNKKQVRDHSPLIPTKTKTKTPKHSDSNFNSDSNGHFSEHGIRKTLRHKRKNLEREKDGSRNLHPQQINVGDRGRNASASVSAVAQRKTRRGPMMMTMMIELYPLSGRSRPPPHRGVAVVTDTRVSPRLSQSEEFQLVGVRWTRRQPAANVILILLSSESWEWRNTSSLSGIL